MMEAADCEGRCDHEQYGLVGIGSDNAGNRDYNVGTYDTVVCRRSFGGFYSGIAGSTSSGSGDFVLSGFSGAAADYKTVGGQVF